MILKQNFNDHLYAGIHLIVFETGIAANHNFEMMIEDPKMHSEIDCFKSHDDFFRVDPEVGEIERNTHHDVGIDCLSINIK